MEIIKRVSETEKETVSTRSFGETMQVSFNNFGHLALRFFGQEYADIPIGTEASCATCGQKIQYLNFNEGKYWVHEHPEHSDKRKCPDGISEASNREPIALPPKETLIVLDQSESDALIRFIKQRLQ